MASFAQKLTKRGLKRTKYRCKIAKLKRSASFSQILQFAQWSNVVPNFKSIEVVQGAKRKPFRSYVARKMRKTRKKEHTGLRFQYMVKMANLINLVLVSPLKVSNCRPKSAFSTRFLTLFPFDHFLDHNPVFEGVLS